MNICWYPLYSLLQFRRSDTFLPIFFLVFVYDHNALNWQSRKIPKVRHSAIRKLNKEFQVFEGFKTFIEKAKILKIMPLKANFLTLHRWSQIPRLASSSLSFSERCHIKRPFFFILSSIYTFIFLAFFYARKKAW